jgi:hypothetical protein
MEDLIKIAQNGQWILEKAKSPEETKRMIEEYLAAKAKAAQPTQRKNPMEGLRPATHGTGENPTYSKEQVAAMRAGIPKEAIDKLPEQVKATSKQKERAHQSSRIDRERAEADEKVRVAQGKKAAWEATTKFLGERGGEKQEKKKEVAGQGYGYGESTGGENKGWSSMYRNLQNQKQLEAAKTTGQKVVKPTELLPPMELYTDDKGQRATRVRQGTMHNQGARTRGKIVHSRVRFPTGQKDEKGEEILGERFIPQQQEHLWSWDHNNKKWNHVKTIKSTIEATTPDKSQEISRPKK